jgi:predicted nucleic acid-binding protein
MSPSFEHFLRDNPRAHLLVDTCVLIDLFFAGQETEDWLKTVVSQHSVVLVGNEAVLTELLKNSKSKAVYDKKARLYLRIIQSDLPLDITALRGAQDMALAYGSLGKDVSFADFLLAGCTKRYTKTYLLTANHKDFPAEVLERKAHFSLEIGNEVRAFAVYGYSEEKYIGRLKQLGF